MKKHEKYLVIPVYLKDFFLSLTDEDAGILLTALSDCHFHGKEPKNLSDRLMGMYSVLKIVTHKDFKL